MVKFFFSLDFFFFSIFLHLYPEAISDSNRFQPQHYDQLHFNFFFTFLVSTKKQRPLRFIRLFICLSFFIFSGEEKNKKNNKTVLSTTSRIGDISLISKPALFQGLLCERFSSFLRNKNAKCPLYFTDTMIY